MKLNETVYKANEQITDEVFNNYIATLQEHIEALQDLLRNASKYLNKDVEATYPFWEYADTVNQYYCCLIDLLMMQEHISQQKCKNIWLVIHNVYNKDLCKILQQEVMSCEDIESMLRHEEINN